MILKNFETRLQMKLEISPKDTLKTRDFTLSTHISNIKHTNLLNTNYSLRCYQWIKCRLCYLLIGNAEYYLFHPLSEYGYSLPREPSDPINL